ncbi:GntR family transcriptional regulator [Salinibius halmophilus]|uniref:GntR family transcriptional regulator n=1 Tax=Salinibius halmophilus TaxID=1853216 RepID=UPI000E66F8CC|nr:GntR family transcriptional regulator [Salinibius halmophilus]
MSDKLSNLIAALQPDTESPTSLYIQLSRRLEQSIREGIIQEGEYLLPERDLATRLGLSRVTVRKAINSLVERGLLEKRQGAGTRVRHYYSETIHKPLSVLNSFSEDMRARGMDTADQWISKQTAYPSPREAQMLGLSPDQRILRLTRVRMAAGIPMAFEIASIPVTVIASEEDVTTSLYDALDAADARPIRAIQTMTAANATEQIAEQLRIDPGLAVLYIERQGYDHNGNAVEYTRSHYRGDLYDFVTELRATE